MLASPPSGFEWLKYTLPYSPIWDWVRVATVVSALFLALFLLRIALGKNRPTNVNDLAAIRLGTLCMVVLLVPVSFQALVAMGEGVPPWRLPLLLVFNFLGWSYVKRRL